MTFRLLNPLALWFVSSAWLSLERTLCPAARPTEEEFEAKAVPAVFAHFVGEAYMLEGGGIQSTHYTLSSRHTGMSSFVYPEILVGQVS